MTSSSGSDDSIVGSLRVEDGAGVVSMVARFDVESDDAWSALTDPA